MPWLIEEPGPRALPEIAQSLPCRRLTSGKERRQERALPPRDAFAPGPTVYKQSMGMLSIPRKTEGLGLIEDIAEGDVEGVMDRPIGNTTDVYAECEKW